MPGLTYGRYFVLDGSIDTVYDWLDARVRRDWAVYFNGMCPINHRPVLSAVFEAEVDLENFVENYVPDHASDELLNLGRRRATFEWPSKKERRVHPERRKLRDRRGQERGGGRRADDLPPQAPDAMRP